MAVRADGPSATQPCITGIVEHAVAQIGFGAGAYDDCGTNVSHPLQLGCMTSNIDSTGVARYPMGNLPVMDPATGATLIDAQGRRSYTTSIAVGPSIGKNIALAYLPHAYCEVERELQIQYIADVYPVKVEAVGYSSLYDPENVRPRS